MHNSYEIKDTNIHKCIFWEINCEQKLDFKVMKCFILWQRNYYVKNKKIFKFTISSTCKLNKNETIELNCQDQIKTKWFIGKLIVHKSNQLTWKWRDGPLL